MHKLVKLSFIFALLLIGAGCVSNPIVESRFEPRCNLNSTEKELFQSFKRTKSHLDWSFMQLSCFDIPTKLKKDDVYSYNGELYRPDLVDDFVQQCKSKATEIINLAKKINGCPPPDDMKWDYEFNRFANIEQSIPQIEEYMAKLINDAEKYKENAERSRSIYIGKKEKEKKAALRKAELISSTEKTTSAFKISISEAQIFYSMFIVEMTVSNITKSKIINTDKFIRTITYENSQGGEDVAFFPIWTLSDNFGNIFQPNSISVSKKPKSQFGPSEMVTLYSSYDVKPIEDSKLKITFDKSIFGEPVALEIPSKLISIVSK